MYKHMKTNKKEQFFPCESCMELLRALADKTRQEIIFLFIKKKELCVNDIAKEFSLSRPTISHHLSLMKRAKLLNSRKEGKEIYHSINKQYVIDTLSSILKNINCCC